MWKKISKVFDLIFVDYGMLVLLGCLLGAMLIFHLVISGVWR